MPTEFSINTFCILHSAHWVHLCVSFYQIFWEAVGLERGPLSLMSTIEDLLGRNSSGSGLENREYSRRDPSRWPRGIPYPQKLALTAPSSGGRSVGIDRSRTHATEFVRNWNSVWLPKQTYVLSTACRGTMLHCGSETPFMPVIFSLRWNAD
jgi:hypothetical protein